MDFFEVTFIAGCDSVSTFESTRPNQQVIKWDNNTQLRVLGMKSSNQFGCLRCDRINDNSGLQIIEERPARMAPFG